MTKGGGPLTAAAVDVAVRVEWSHDRGLVALKPDFGGQLRVPGRSGARGVDEVGGRKLVRVLQDTPPKVEYPALHGMR